ncbi:DUF6446 family protein [Roseivivax sp.]
MSGKLVALVILACAAIGGAAMYYLQVFAYYERTPDQAALELLATEASLQEIAIANYQGIDADSSPLRYRACFDLETAPEAVEGVPYEGAVPRNAPFWFSCFDAEEIGAQIASGEARVLTVARNIEFGIDRVVALTEAGRGYVWQEVNDCGEKAYDGTPLGDDCPTRE